MNNFDFERNFKHTARFAFVAFLFQAAFGISLAGAFAWVAWHFISKFW